MEHTPDLSPASTPSRRASHIDTNTHGIPSHSQHVQFRGDSRPSVDDLHPDSSSRVNGGLRTSMDVKEEDVFDEQSPLLPPRTSEEIGKVPALSGVTSPDESSGEVSWDGDIGSKEESKSSWYLFLLTISLGGLQVAWSVELSNGSPYLLTLGISKSLLAFVWIAGPLSGTLVQPYVGIKSDRCRLRFGKRRPFMVVGAVATIVSLMVLAWTREIVGGFLRIFGVASDSQGTKTLSTILAVLMIYILDFSINVIQAGIRAFIVDNSPTHQQDSANAWASRLSGIGNIVGYLFGYANLPKYLWFFGNTQFKVLCVIASLLLAITLAVSCLSVSERDPRLEGEPRDQNLGVVAFFKTLFHSVRRLPPQIKNVCIVQLAAWVGWFPFLFYITTYIGELYVDPVFRKNPNMTDKEIDASLEHGTRIGTFALLIYALVSFAASVALPWFIVSSYKAPEPPLRTPMTPTSPLATRNLGAARASETVGDGYFGIQPASRLASAVDPADSGPIRSAQPVQKLLAKMKGRVPRLEIPWLTLKRAWLLSHIMFALLTWLTFLAHDTTVATIITGLIGIPWAMTMWAPFALIAAEISKRDNIRRGLIRPPATRDGELLSRGEDTSEGADQAGVVLGIHNVAIAAPQVVATLISSAIFKALQKPRGEPGDNSVAWVLRFGGIMALVAAYLTRRVAEEGDEEDTPPKW
ncbi:General alpha-glucoside permease [Lecanosticta acicola]|uniref:General alpha-glucoside permease n=1 Tax=Lecanosticta acicola TaxID=111012 RepID=A0AAI9E7X2_9PEZI|nr:General alpha-glucoside permease [Lecanosticta acicola]